MKIDPGSSTAATAFVSSLSSFDNNNVFRRNNNKTKNRKLSKRQMMTVSNQNINLESLPSTMGLFESHSNDFVASPTSFQSLSSSSLWLSQQQEVATSSASTSFEAVPPDTTTLIGMGAVFVLCVIAAFVWNNSVVPVSRTKLAISKSRGEVKEYLDELQQGATVDNNIMQNSTTAMLSTDEEGDIQEPATTVAATTTDTTTDGRDFERWLFTDWLEQKERKGGRQKEPALPILKDAKWNSGDNPVVVTSALMLVGVLVASVTERVIQ